MLLSSCMFDLGKGEGDGRYLQLAFSDHLRITVLLVHLLNPHQFSCAFFVTSRCMKLLMAITNRLGYPHPRMVYPRPAFQGNPYLLVSVYKKFAYNTFLNK